jgi:hypothetical protein
MEVLMSKGTLKRRMLRQELIDRMTRELNHLESGSTKLGIYVEVLEDSSIKSIDNVGYLILNKDKLQQGEGKELDIVDDMGHKMENLFEHQSSYSLQENDMEVGKILYKLDETMKISQRQVQSYMAGNEKLMKGSRRVESN